MWLPAHPKPNWGIEAPLFFFKGEIRMKKSLVSTLALAFVAIVLVAFMFVMNTGVFTVHTNAITGTTIHLVAHADTHTLGDASHHLPREDTLAKILTFAHPI